MAQRTCADRLGLYGLEVLDVAAHHPHQPRYGPGDRRGDKLDIERYDASADARGPSLIDDDAELGVLSRLAERHAGWALVLDALLRANTDCASRQRVRPP